MTSGDRTTALVVEPVPWDDPDATRLREAQRVEIVARYGGDDSEPGTKPSATDVAVLLLARDAGGEAVGCGALRHLEGTVGEIKRMYVPPEHRGKGVARAVLAALEEHARGLGWTHLWLETGTRQPEAVGLYTSAGYAPIPNYGPYAGSPWSLCFERAIS